ncbi:MAG: ThuA domain-containing protein [Chlorobi bacterium]|nr:ThuA domain-containing protein [Chlorobiota bacterium]
MNVLSAQKENNSKKIKVLIVDGYSNHNWRQTTKVVKHILKNAGMFSVSVSTAPSESGAKEWETWEPQFDRYDVVIQNTNNIFNKKIKWPRRVQKELEDYVSSGGGLFILHSANNAYANWPEYNLMIGLGWRKPDEGVALQVTDDGKIKTIPIGEGRKTYHGPRNDEVINIITDHPINRGFPKKWKTPDMELYKFARGPAKNLTVLSYATDDETGINWPVEWVVKYGKGRVYNSSMGHLWQDDIYPVTYRCVGFQTTLIRVTEWLATGKTTWPVPENFPTATEIRLVNDSL